MNQTESAAGTITMRELLQGAAEWQMISMLFECPCDGWFERLDALRPEVRDERLRRAAELARAEAGEGLYHTTFGPGGPAAPREASYHDSLLAGRTLALLRAQYEAFGYAPASREAPDHVAVEAGFVAFLLLKEAYARHAGDDEKAAVALEARRAFLAEHLAAAVPLAETLALSGIEHLALAADAMRDRVCVVVSKI